MAAYLCATLAGCDAPVPGTDVPPADIKPVSAAIAVNTNSTVSPVNDLVGNNIVLDVSNCTAEDCDDSNPCTTDSCSAKGACVHKSLLCASTTCSTRACSSKTGQCENSGALNEGGTCDDGNLCTDSDTCQSGSCKGSQKVCASDGNACTNEVCDVGTGSCVYPSVANGMSCQAACIPAGTCTAGVCTGATASCDDNNICTTDGCDAPTGNCTHTNVTDGKGCSDNNVCNGGETCKSGVCSPGTALSCDDKELCTDDACDPAAGCKHSFNTLGCDDSKACTYGEHCVQGACGGGIAVVCTDDTCNARACNGTATCSATPKIGTVCDDGKDCTYADMCNDQGRCSGQPIACTSDATTIRSCNSTSKCNESPRTGAPCDDSNPCTKDDALRSDGICAGTVYTCAVTACVAGNVCDGKGGCKVTPKPDGSVCDADNTKCTPNDVCKAGVCVPDPTPVACVSKDCNSVACDQDTGNCQYKPTSGGECGVTGCYTRGVCKTGVCSGQPKDCSAFNGPCNDGICNAETGECLSGPKPNGTSCATSAQCAVGAVCAFGTCELTPMACPAATGPCMTATCDVNSGQCGQSTRPIGSPCDPANGCIESATCTADGKCIGAPSPNGDPCTTTDGQLGVCAFGSCAASGGDALQGGATGQDAAVGDPVAGTSGTDKPKDSSSGCRLAGGGEPGAGLVLLMAVAWMWSRRRSAGGQKRTEKHTKR